MRTLALGYAVALAACTYDDPAYQATMFRCDPAHACPSSQTCLGGVCQRSGSDNDGVKCGGTLTCTPGQQCCVDGTNAPRCLAASESCPGTGALCDGVRDCDAASVCCDGANQVACGDANSCNTLACAVNADCPSDEPNCCHVAATGGPWGDCYLACP